MIRRKISEDFTLRLYKKSFEGLSTQTLSLDYLQTSDVYGFFQHGKLVAGFVVRTAPGMWHMKLLEQSGISPEAVQMREGQFCELFGLWMSPKVASPTFRMNFYLTCVADALQTGREFIIGGSPVKEIVSTHQVCLPFSLYSGSIKGQAKDWHIYYGTRWTCLKGVARQFPGRLKDIIKAQPGDHHPEEVPVKPLGRWHKVAGKVTRGLIRK
ncbi:MAG: hypothetical protein MI867_04945 [Pseudomonadales bacterium]|nr:hypothetical protein [Pseudomonadales bacterium]